MADRMVPFSGKRNRHNPEQITDLMLAGIGMMTAYSVMRPLFSGTYGQQWQNIWAQQHAKSLFGPIAVVGDNPRIIKVQPTYTCSGYGFRIDLPAGIHIERIDVMSIIPNGYSGSIWPDWKLVLYDSGERLLDPAILQSRNLHLVGQPAGIAQVALNVPDARLGYEVRCWQPLTLEHCAVCNPAFRDEPVSASKPVPPGIDPTTGLAA